MERERALETSDILFLELVKEEREGALLFSLFYLLVTRINSFYGLYKSSICLKRDLETITSSFRNSLKQVLDIRANSQYGRKLLNRALFKEVLLYKVYKVLKRR